MQWLGKSNLSRIWPPNRSGARRGVRPPEKIRAWTERHLKWVKALRFEHQGRTQLLQRRAHARTDCIAAVIVTAEGRAPQRGLTLNLSGGGLLVRGLSGLQVGDELGFDLRLDLLPARIKGRCRVVRVTPDGFHGVQFSEMDEGERDRLVRFAYQREKAAREARLGY